jgi:hypothetical protein
MRDTKPGISMYSLDWDAEHAQASVLIGANIAADVAAGSQRGRHWLQQHRACQGTCCAHGGQQRRRCCCEQLSEAVRCSKPEHADAADTLATFLLCISLRISRCSRRCCKTRYFNVNLLPFPCKPGLTRFQLTTWRCVCVCVTFGAGAQEAV